MRTIFTILLIYFLYRIVRRMIQGPSARRRIFVDWGSQSQQPGPFGQSDPFGGRTAYHRDDDQGDRVGHIRRTSDLSSIQDAEFEEIPDEPEDSARKKPS